MKNKGSSFIEKRARYGYIFILPLIIGIIFIFVPNIVLTLRYSLSDIDSSNNFSMHLTGFKYYKEAFVSDAEFIPLLTKNIRELVVNVPVILIYSLFISTILNQEFIGRTIARIIFFIPVILVTGAIASTDSTALFYGGAGQIIDSGANYGMSDFSDMSTLLSSINFPEVFKNIVVNAVSNIYNVACSSGLQIFIFLAGLQEIPISLYEAAQIEGCSKWEVFWKITFPMIKPQIAVNAVYTIAASATEKNDVLQHASDIAFGQNDYSLGSAINILYLLILSVIVTLVLIVLKKSNSNAEM